MRGRRELLWMWARLFSVALLGLLLAQPGLLPAAEEEVAEEEALEEEAFEGDGEEEDAVWDRLDRPVTLRFDGTPFRQVVDELRKVTGLNLIIHQQFFAEHADYKVTFAVEETSLWTALDLLARSLELRLYEFERSLYLEPRSVQAQRRSAGTIRLPVGRGFVDLVITADDIPAERRRELIEAFLDRAEEPEPDFRDVARRIEWMRGRRRDREPDRPEREEDEDGEPGHPPRPDNKPDVF